MFTNSSSNHTLRISYMECTYCGHTKHPDFDGFQQPCLVKYGKLLLPNEMNHDKECPECGFPMRVHDTYVEET